MNCNLCQSKSEVYCSCANIFLCDTHIDNHMKMPGIHQVESIDLELNNSEINELKNEALTRIKNVQTSKKEIFSVAKRLIKEIENSVKAAIEKLNKFENEYILLAKVVKFSSSLKLKAQRMIATSIKLKKVNLNLKAKFINVFTEDLVTIFEKNQDFSTGVDNNSLFITQGANYWEPEQKINFLESQNIKHYQDLFKAETWRKIKEIKFSNDSKYSFICNFYSGKFKKGTYK